MSMSWTLQQARLSCGAEFQGRPEDLSCDIAGIEIDSRKTTAGQVFIAIKGEQFDGHSFVPNVVAAGALACVVGRSWWESGAGAGLPGNFLVVPDTIAALQALALAYRRAVNPVVFGLTGTNGKTSSKEMIARVLAPHMRVHKSQGNFNNHIGVPLTLLGMPADTQAVVVEMGANHFGEIAALCRIAEPAGGLITNIGKGHTEYFGDLDGVRRAKQELFDWLAHHGTGLVNADDPMVVQAAKAAGLQSSLTYGFNTPAAIRGRDARLTADGHAEFTCEGQRVHVGLPGLHNAQNALAAFAAGRHFQIAAADIAVALRDISPIPGRMQLRRLAGRLIIDDTYNANPSSMRAALAYLAAYRAGGRKFAVLGDMFELGEHAVLEHLALLQSALMLQPAAVFLVGELMAAALEVLKDPEGKCRHFEDKKGLAKALAQMTQSGDVLLFKGSRGSRMEEIILELEKTLAQK